jgi:hypothetical protein
MDTQVAQTESEYTDIDGTGGSDVDEEYDPLGLNDHDPDKPMIGTAGLSEGELALFVLDWIAAHKITDKAGKDIWNMIQCVLPEGTSMRTFWAVKKSMRAHELSSVVPIEICPNDCVAYFNSVHLKGVQYSSLSLSVFHLSFEIYVDMILVCCDLFFLQ